MTTLLLLTSLEGVARDWWMVEPFMASNIFNLWLNGMVRQWLELI